MLPILNENYFIDLDAIERFLDMTESKTEPTETEEPNSNEVKVNLVKFELVKMLLETVLLDQEFPDEKLGIKGMASTSVPFKLAFNSLLNKKLINKY